MSEAGWIPSRLARTIGGGDLVGDAPRSSRRRRREEKQRLHEAHRKARAIDKANDKRNAGRDKQGKKNKDKKEKKGKR